MKETELNEREVRTVLAVFDELQKMPYSKLNTFLGSLTIKELSVLREKLNDWYQEKVAGKVFDEEYGWIDTNANECSYAHDDEF